MQEIVTALKAMAQGDQIDTGDGDAPPPTVKRDSPLARTQRLRIMGRTIRSGLE